MICKEWQCVVTKKTSYFYRIYLKDRKFGYPARGFGHACGFPTRILNMEDKLKEVEEVSKGSLLFYHINFFTAYQATT